MCGFPATCRAVPLIILGCAVTFRQGSFITLDAAHRHVSAQARPAPRRRPLRRRGLRRPAARPRRSQQRNSASSSTPPTSTTAFAAKKPTPTWPSARELAAALGIPFHEARVDVAAEAQANPATGKPAESIEEAARRLRYHGSDNSSPKTPLDAIATAHTLDDQAETVLAKFLRGAWTEGLSGIHPELEGPEGASFARSRHHPRRNRGLSPRLGQTWREDSTNRHLTFTRNRIRHELLPLLEGWNPRLREHLHRWPRWRATKKPGGRRRSPASRRRSCCRAVPSRGGGRASGDAPPMLSIDVTRLAALAPALQRRLLRHAAGQLDAAPDFAATEALRTLALTGRAGQKLELAQGFRAERTHRELRLSAGPIAASAESSRATTRVHRGDSRRNRCPRLRHHACD